MVKNTTDQINIDNNSERQSTMNGKCLTRAGTIMIKEEEEELS
jgi:hypothetical protein